MQNLIIAVTVAVLAALATSADAADLEVTLPINFVPGENIVWLGDQDGDGKLSLQEASEFLGKLDIVATAESLKRFDLDHDGYLSAEEIDKALLLSPENFIKLLDSNGDGKLSLNEFKAFADKAGLDLTDEQIESLDLDHDGYLSVEEVKKIPDALLEMYRKETAEFVQKIKDAYENVTQTIEYVMKEVLAPLLRRDAKFKLAPVTLSLKKAAELLQGVGVTVTVTQLERYDTDKDGMLSEEELETVNTGILAKLGLALKKIGDRVAQAWEKVVAAVKGAGDFVKQAFN